MGHGGLDWAQIEMFRPKPFVLRTPAEMLLQRPARRVVVAVAGDEVVVVSGLHAVGNSCLIAV